MGVSASHIHSVPPLPPYYLSALSRLNATLGGRVHAVVPFSRPCFPLAASDVHGHLDPEACARAIETYTQRDNLTSDFGAYLNSAGTVCQATGEQCLLDWGTPGNTHAFLPPSRCEQGNLPSYYVDVRSAQDIIAAFDFTRRTGMPLSIKNTGHDYLGRSSAVGSLALWMHNIQDLSFSESFVPSGCNSNGGPAVTFGTGVLLGELAKFADSHNVTIPGGADSSIASGGGYVMGGGHSAFSNTLGLAVDQVLEFEVVTPDGAHRIVNACSDVDLFSALRGGGGGTFGVVLRVTMRALPRLTFPVVVTAFKGVPTISVQEKYVEFLIDNALPLATKGWGGYIDPALGLTFVNPLVNMNEAAETMADLKHLVENKLNGTFLLQKQTSYLSFYDQFVRPTTIPDNAPSVLASRLIPATVFKSPTQRKELRDAILAAAQRHTIVFLFAVAPYFFKDDGMTSVSPAWRSSIWHVMYIDYWTYNATISQRTQIYHRLEADTQVLRNIAPKSGVYWNEASLFEPDYTVAFWGDQYDKLLAVKRKYDPDHLLDCWKCVGWKGHLDPRYRCQPKTE